MVRLGTQIEFAGDWGKAVRGVPSIERFIRHTERSIARLRSDRMINKTLISFAALALPFAASAQTASGPELSKSSQSGKTSQSDSEGNSLNVRLPDGVTSSMLGERDTQMIAVQVMLDRSRHSPGVVDGYMGGNTKRAIRYYRKANGLPNGDGIDGELLRSLLKTQGGDVFQTYTITDSDLADGFVTIPDGFAELATLDRLGFESAQEMFGEKFHMDQEFLEALNPAADFTKAGTKLTIISHGDEKLSADIAKIEVRKGENSVAILDAAGKLLGSYPATIGSGEFPSPSGNMKVSAIATEPKYYFDPERQNWGPDKRLEIAAGPNNPIGGTWIDLGKNGYGIHGSPDPHKVAKRASHGCVRLTNWDADELAHAVGTGTPVVFI